MTRPGAVNRGSLANPEIIDWYVEQARSFHAREDTAR